MASDRPLFDDENLPDWLKNAGITFGGQQEAAGSTGPASANAPWLSAESSADLAPTPTLPWEEPSVEGGAALPWMQDLAPAESAQASASVSPFGDLADNEAAIDWEQTAEPESAVERPPG